MFEELCKLSNSGPDYRVSVVIPEVAKGSDFAWYEPECRKTTPLSDSEFAAWSSSEGSMLFREVGTGSHLKKLASFSIGRVEADDMEIVCPESGPYLFLCSARVRNELEGIGSRGLEFLELINRDGKLHRDWFGLSSALHAPISPGHLCGSRILREGAIEIDSRIALAYDLRELPQVCAALLTSEHYGDGFPRLMLSRTTVQFLKEREVRGLVYRPVFEVGSRAHAELLEEVSRVRSAVQRNSENRWLQPFNTR